MSRQQQAWSFQPWSSGIASSRPGRIQRRYNSSTCHRFKTYDTIVRSENILRLSQGPTCMDVPLSKGQLVQVKQALVSIMGVFLEKQEYEGQTDSRPKRWKSVDVCIEPGTTGVQLDLFCNPNACSNAFEARVLITLQVVPSDLRVVTEIALEELKQSYSTCLSENHESQLL